MFFVSRNQFTSITASINTRARAHISGTSKTTPRRLRIRQSTTATYSFPLPLSTTQQRNQLNILRNAKPRSQSSHGRLDVNLDYDFIKIEDSGETG